VQRTSDALHALKQKRRRIIPTPQGVADTVNAVKALPRTLMLGGGRLIVFGTHMPGQ
jgi:hypothetical protein